MLDSDNSKTEETNDQKKDLTISQRIDQLDVIPEITKPIGACFCIVCGNPRIRYEPTGLVCSNPNCLLGLKENYDESEKETKDWFGTLLKEIAPKIGVDIPKDVVEACKKINEKLDTITFELRELVLGALTCADLSNSTDNLSEISEKIQTEVGKIVKALKEKEEKTD